MLGRFFSAVSPVSAVVAPGLLLSVCLTASPQFLRASDVNALPSKPADVREAYGADSQQFGDLRLPRGAGPFPVAVIVHGGCWVSTMATLQNTAALADALRRDGMATWNVEYRRLDQQGGGWPGTFADVAAGIDHLRTLATSHPLDLTRVITIGHSAGAHLALWLAARGRLPASNPLRGDAPLLPTAVVALGGPGDLAEFSTRDAQICGSPVISRLMGGRPADVPDRYKQGSPIELLPLGVRQVLIAGEQDGVMPERALDAYVKTARKAGDRAESIRIPEASHFEVIAPGTPAWDVVRGTVVDLTRKKNPGDRR